MPCARKSNLPELRRLRLEHVDERRADDLALLLRIGDAGEPIEEQRRRVDEDQRQLQPLEALADLRRLVEPQHAVVDEDARQLIADRAVNEQRRDRRVDAAAQRRRRRGRRPTCARIRAVASSTNDAIVQSPVQPQTSKAKLRRISRPRSVWTTSG